MADEPFPSPVVPEGEWDACMASITNTLARLERTRRAHPGPDITIAITTLEAVQDRFRRVPKS